MFDPLGDRMKSYEDVECGRCLLHGVPVVARMDGRAFHRVTRKFDRPYEKVMSDIMVDTTVELVRETGACFGYTQSDEITLVWAPPGIGTEVWFGGRVSKMVSNLASYTTALFNMHYPRIPADKRIAGLLPTFDARVFCVPTKDEAATCVWWRELDATRNSIQMAARAQFSHNQCNNKNTSELHEMLFQAGINWNDYPAFFKRGTMVTRRKEMRHFTVDEIDKLPPKHLARTNPDLKVLRSVVEPVNVPPFSYVSNRTAVVFDGAVPESNWIERADESQQESQAAREEGLLQVVREIGS